MKIILVSQRVEVVASYGERRDCLDQNWGCFLRTCGYLPVPVMNAGTEAEELIKTLRPAGILLTGGNDLARYGGSAPERDATEHRLIEEGLRYGIPLMGVCRGMQVIADHFGAPLKRIEGHVASRHLLNGAIAREVNSYHAFAAAEVPEGFTCLARAEDGVIEAMACPDRKTAAVMWHPERVEPFSQEDLALFKQHFEGSEETK